MLCYPLYFGASIHSAVHHRFCLKTCIKLKQQNLYCHLIGYCHFPGVYLPRTTVIVSSHHLCLHIWEVPKALPKARCRKSCGKAAQGSLPGVPCHTPGGKWGTEWLSKTKLLLSCKVSHSLQHLPSTHPNNQGFISPAHWKDWLYLLGWICSCLGLVIYTHGKCSKSRGLLCSDINYSHFTQPEMSV